MVSSMLFIAVVVAAAILAPLRADTACSCLPGLNDTIAGSSIGHRFTVFGPTSDGTYTGTPCAATCNVTLIYNGYITEGKGVGASITVMSPTGLSSTNYVEFYGGSNLERSLSSDTDTAFSITDSNVITFAFHFQSNASIIIFAVPIDQVAVATTTPSPATTPAYNGSYPVNPALVRLDLIIGIDISQTSIAAFNAAKDVIKSVVNSFSYSDETVRLSLFRFTPNDILPYGFFEVPWSLNATTFATALDNVVAFSGDSSDYFTQLNGGLFAATADSDAGTPAAYPFRNNTERVLLIFTASDAKSADDITVTAVQNKIQQSDLRIVLANTNKSINVDAVNFPQLSNLGKSTPNPLTTYQFGANDAVQVQTLLNQTIFNGNELSKLVNSGIQSIPSPVTPITVPNGFLRYTTFTNYVLRYIPENEKIIKLTFNYFETNYNKDFIIISVDGVEVSRLTGQYGYAPYYCLDAKQEVSVTLTTSYGKVYKGYQIKVESSTLTDCLPKPTKSIEYAESGKIMKYIQV